MNKNNKEQYGIYFITLTEYVPDIFSCVPIKMQNTNQSYTVGCIGVC